MSMPESIREQLEENEAEIVSIYGRGVYEKAIAEEYPAPIIRKLALDPGDTDFLKGFLG